MTDKIPPTPGPWYFRQAGNCLGISSLSTGISIVTSGVHGRTDEEAVANARLMAAAPEMFAVLVEIIKRDEEHPVTRLAQFAYEKAVYGS